MRWPETRTTRKPNVESLLNLNKGNRRAHALKHTDKTTQKETNFILFLRVLI